MKILLDTNLLTRLAEPGNSQYQLAFDSTKLLKARGHDLVLVPQVVYEFWVVCTRPVANNGLGLSSAECETLLTQYKVLFPMQSDSSSIFPEWEKLVISNKIIGKNAHDARLVAAMSHHQITHLLTFNDKDFNRFQAIVVLTPSGVVNSPP